MAQIKRAAPVPVWWVRHPDHEVAIVRAPNWEQATVEAAKWWDVPWREVAALCELEKKELAPRCICQKCGERFHGEAVLCEKKGVMSPASHCRSFRYDPLKRVPPRPVRADFSRWKEEDFQL